MNCFQSKKKKKVKIQRNDVKFLISTRQTFTFSRIFSFTGPYYKDRFQMSFTIAKLLDILIYDS